MMPDLWPPTVLTLYLLLALTTLGQAVSATVILAQEIEILRLRHALTSLSSSTSTQRGNNECSEESDECVLPTVFHCLKQPQFKRLSCGIGRLQQLVKQCFTHCPRDSRYSPCNDEANNLVHRGNRTAIPSASQEVKHDGQESQGIPADGTTDKAESTEGGEHGQS